MHDDIRELFETSFRGGVSDFASCEETSVGHGRVEKRTCFRFACGEVLQCSAASVQQPAERGLSLAAERWLLAVESLRRRRTSSLPVDPEKALRVAVQHWDVENPLHWTLDMVFDEDHSRARSGYAAENLAIVRHVAFNMIRLDRVTAGGMSRKKKSMTWNAENLRMAILAA